jgi:acetylornithine deacetylase/succinyl-diaminopimelate desuccinylase-like protein
MLAATASPLPPSRVPLPHFQKVSVFMAKELQEFLATARDRQLNELIEWLRIPSISAMPAHKADVHAAAEWLAGHLRTIGLENVRVIESDIHPLVYADWLHAGADAPTVLCYGHFDVQPVDPLAKWDSPPFEPALRGDDLYARGASDDKGQTFIHVKAVEALLATRGRLPVNLKFLIEGEEEFGGETIDAYVKSHQGELACDAVLISDTHILSPTQPSIIYGLRGMWAAELTVTTARRDLHSGSFGGAVHNANQALAELLAGLHDSSGRVAVPGFYDAVLPLTEEERAALSRVPYGEAELLGETGIAAPWGEEGYTIVERIGARPTLEINGLWGGFTGDGFKTVIPYEAHAKLSCRLVPDQEPAQITAAIEAHLRGAAPPTADVKLSVYHGAGPFLAPFDSPAVQAAARAYRRTFGVEPVYMREGGSIPIGATFQQTLGAPVVFMGFGLADDNLHAPNEKMHLPNFYRGIETVIAFFEELLSKQTMTANLSGQQTGD